MTILVVGLGLIGGSLAKALAQCTGHEIWGLDRDSLAVQAALELSLIHIWLSGFET